MEGVKRQPVLTENDDRKKMGTILAHRKSHLVPGFHFDLPFKHFLLIDTSLLLSDLYHSIPQIAS